MSRVDIPVAAHSNLHLASVSFPGVTSTLRLVEPLLGLVTNLPGADRVKPWASSISCGLLETGSREEGRL